MICWQKKETNNLYVYTVWWEAKVAGYTLMVMPKQTSNTMWELEFWSDDLHELREIKAKSLEQAQRKCLDLLAKYVEGQYKKAIHKRKRLIKLGLIKGKTNNATFLYR